MGRVSVVFDGFTDEGEARYYRVAGAWRTTATMDSDGVWWAKIPRRPDMGFIPLRPCTAEEWKEDNKCHH